MRAGDRELIERTRMINKTLSMFVFALQEELCISVDRQLDVVEMLLALSEAVLARAEQQAATEHRPGIVDSPAPRLLEPSCGDQACER